MGRVTKNREHDSHYLTIQELQVLTRALKIKIKKRNVGLDPFGFPLDLGVYRGLKTINVNKRLVEKKKQNPE